ncbi:MAG: PAS domain-containing protein [Alphaproteobacteria bacterium]|nr:MAG: PAS domain-containing protein [Alphaproteobacteria bacterium]
MTDESRVRQMRYDENNIDYVRPALTAIPVAVCTLLLLAAGYIDVYSAVALGAATIIGLLWLLARYRTDIRRERRRALILAKRGRRPSRTAALLTRIVDGISDPLILLDNKRVVVHANRAALSLLGHNIVGRDISFYLRHPMALTAIEQALTKETSTECEITLIDPMPRECLLRTSVIRASDSVDENDDELFLILSLYDVTRIKMAEKMRADFVANASHELRTPLASILGFIETLAGPAAQDEEARRRFLSIMGEEASRMQRLIDDLLSLSRIEMNQHLPPDGSVDIGALLKGLVDTLELSKTDTTCPIRLSLPDEMPLVRGDRDQLVQVFQNIIDNALKYGRPGDPVQISVELRNSMPTRSFPGVAISVTNQGDPIPPEHIPRLTERFYRVDSARSRKLGGTGLGLAIVKHIVNRHRGALTIESNAATGTTVTVFLPILTPARDRRHQH